jgi:hypothetical protein
MLQLAYPDSKNDETAVKYCLVLYSTVISLQILCIINTARSNMPIYDLTIN